MELRQLQYFLACAKAGSFSEAAKTLYSTQSNVSKAVKGLEDSLGLRLFERMPRGIRLTVQGERVYQYACKILNEVQALEQISGEESASWLRISFNPSSWFANQFVEFYKKQKDRNYRYQIYTAGTRTVLERVRDYLDDVGFLYVRGRDKDEFYYELERNRLNFTMLCSAEEKLYPGRGSFLYGRKPTEGGISEEDLKKCRFIQNDQDDFSGAGKGGDSVRDSLNLAVLTNSDYIMEKMLKETDVANISGSYLSGSGASRELSLALPEREVLFGYVQRKGDQPDTGIREFIQFLEEKLLFRNESDV